MSSNQSLFPPGSVNTTRAIPVAVAFATNAPFPVLDSPVPVDVNGVTSNCVPTSVAKSPSSDATIFAACGAPNPTVQASPKTAAAAHHFGTNIELTPPVVINADVPCILRARSRITLKTLDLDKQAQRQA